MEVGNAFFRAGLARCAFVVLSGAVITSFVRTGDLVGRMAVDRCLPRASSTGTLSQGTDSVFLVCLFALCVSQVVMLDCNIEALDGVYCFKFLSVMTIFLFREQGADVRSSGLILGTQQITTTDPSANRLVDRSTVERSSSGSYDKPYIIQSV